MKWRKLGRIFVPDGTVDWMRSHAAVPVVDRIDSDVVKVYFSPRDAQGRSYTGYVVVDLRAPTKILDVSREPVLSPGRLGAFDDSGAMGTCLIDVGHEKYFYYIGWNLGVTVPFRNSIGLARSVDGGVTFTRYAEGPIIDRTPLEPHFTASCCVLHDESRYRIWYLSCLDWESVNGKPQHRYHIKYGESPDGINWERKGLVAIDFKSEDEYAISVPRVIRDKSGYKMWYSYRGRSYRIGYAESPDGYVWERRDELSGIDVSDTGWDSEMICYPCVFDHNGERYMFYNGNGYGQSGFGLAVLDSDN
ncbi:MAG TPA: hypothetical protein V6D08_07465 [Candidatus Obscuribacterales bacterium]